MNYIFDKCKISYSTLTHDHLDKLSKVYKPITVKNFFFQILNKNILMTLAHRWCIVLIIRTWNLPEFEPTRKLNLGFPLIGYLEFWGQISNFEFNLFRVKRLYRRSEMFESPFLRLPKMEWIRFVTINTNINIITTSYQAKCIGFDWCWKDGCDN